MNDNLLVIFGTLGVSLAVGLLIGLERGWRLREEVEGARTAGLRTFGVIGFTGGLCALLAEMIWDLFIGIGLLAVTVVMVVSYWYSSRERGDYGVTSVFAALATFMLGAVATSGYPAVAAAGAVVLAMLLGLKPELHRWLSRIDRDELMAALKLLLISVVLLPLLPDRGIGPWDSLNPYRLWWLVVLIAGISFAGHFAIRIAGQRRGILLTGLFGGMASSTALTLSFSQLGRTATALQPWLAPAVLIAAATMFLRMLIEIAVVNPGLLGQAAPVLLIMTVAGFGVALLAYLLRRDGRQVADVDIGRPFQLRIVLQFAVLLAVVAVLSEIAGERYGEQGIYVLALISGLADVDAITLALARMAAHGLDETVAVNGMVIAAMANTGVKAAMVVFIAGGRMAGGVLSGAAAMIITGFLFLAFG